MGASASVLENSSASQLAELAERSNCNAALVEAIRNGNVDGKELLANYSALSTRLEDNKIIENKDDDLIAERVDVKCGLVLDFNGQTVAWYLRWAIENKIPGYCQWMMKRSWAWFECRSKLEPAGWTFEQIQRGIIGCFAETGFGYDAESVTAWLKHRGETPGNGPELEAVETTGSVAYRLIKPLTEESKKTFRQTFLTGSEHNAITKPATHFLSHSWSYPFWSVIEGLIHHQLGYDRMWMYICGLKSILDALDAIPPEDLNYYWFDLFNKNQHIVTSDSTALELEQGIRNPGHIVVLLHPIEKWALNRVWCLFEVLVATQVDAVIEITYSFEMVDVFERQKINDGDTMKRIPWFSLDRYRNLSIIDVAQAQATVDTDRVYILNLIEKGIGCAKLNGLCYKLMNEAFESSSYGLGRKREGEEGCIAPSNAVDNDPNDFVVLYDEREI